MRFVMAANTASKAPPGSSSPSAVVPTASEQTAQGKARAELLVRRHIRSGWLLIAIGVIVPILALGGPFYGVRVSRFGRRGAGAALIAVGFAVFLARLILWLG
jgi:hypothetical protein